MSTDTDLAARVARLEATVRSTRRIAAGLAIALAALVSVAAVQGQGQGKAVEELRVKTLVADTIAAKEGLIRKFSAADIMLFDSKDAKVRTILTPGQIDVESAERRAVLAAAKGYCGIQLGDQDAEKSRLIMSLSDRGAVLTLFDRKGQARTALGGHHKRAGRGGGVLQLPESALTMWGADGAEVFAAPK